ncbi:MAG: hypothetical protein GX962_02210 [Epulopiscium sp.]|mgnify:CR=1 FL=1|nr:hypothetical protein [Candidatus Epulonipiscium sp.]
MDCKNHYGRAGLNTCSKCGDWICEECVVHIEGRNICKNCIQSYVRAGEEKTVPIGPRGSVNGFMVFIFSFLPGAAHMYMGLSKIGLMLLSLFMGSCVMAQFYTLTPFALTAAGIVWIYSFFDARNTKHKVLRGEAKDDITPYVEYVKKNKGVFAILCIIIGAMIGFQEFSRIIERIVGRGFFGWLRLDQVLFAALFILGGLWLIATNRKGSGEEEIDTRNKVN